MATTGEDALSLLRSIDASLKQLVQAMRARAPQSSASPPVPAGKPVADDRDLDGTYGDPELRFTPRDWTGESYKGRRFSECPAELLDLVAETFEYFADQAEQKKETTSTGKPVAPYKRKDAARARGWAQRIRAGTHRPAAAAPTSPEWVADLDDEIPFMWLLPILLPVAALMMM